MRGPVLGWPSKSLNPQSVFPKFQAWKLWILWILEVFQTPKQPRLMAQAQGIPPFSKKTQINGFLELFRWDEIYPKKNPEVLEHLVQRILKIDENGRPSPFPFKKKGPFRTGDIRWHFQGCKPIFLLKLGPFPLRQFSPGCPRDTSGRRKRNSKTTVTTSFSRRNRGRFFFPLFRPGEGEGWFVDN